MKQLTDEQYRGIVSALNRAGFYIALADGTVPPEQGVASAGRTAYEAAYPLAIEEALAEPTRDEVRPVQMECYPICGGLSDADMEVYRRIFANRRASLTAKPDPAVELVEMMIAANHSAISIVAAVRAADQKAGRA